MDEEKRFEITTAQFELFREEVRYWIERFGLKQWQLFIAHEELDDAGSLARVTWKRDQMQAKIMLNKVLDNKEQDANIARAGFHEVVELLLAEVSDQIMETLAYSRADAMTHQLIRTLENAVWMPDWLARSK